MFLPNGLISLTYSVPDYSNIQTIFFLLGITRQLIFVRQCNFSIYKSSRINKISCFDRHDYNKGIQEEYLHIDSK